MNFLQQFDVAIFEAIHGLSSRSALFDTGLYWLNWFSIAAFITVVVGYFFVNKKIALIAGISALLNRFVLVELVRLFIARLRPFEILDKVTPLIGTEHLQSSFPSGHAAVFFAIAFAIYMQNRKMGTVLLAVSTLLSLNRIYLGVHFLSDIIMSAVLAFISVKLIAFLVNKLFSSKFESKEDLRQ